MDRYDDAVDFVENNIKAFMSIGFRPVYLAAVVDDLKVYSVTITSLISTRVETGSEEVAFVLRNSSSFISMVRVFKIFSIYLLESNQKELAVASSSQVKPSDVIGKYFDLDPDSKALNLKSYCARIDLVFKEVVARGENSIVYATVESTITDVAGSRPPLMYGYGKFQEVQSTH